MYFDKRTLPINIWFIVLVEHFAKAINAKESVTALNTRGFTIHYSVILKVYRDIRAGIVAYMKSKFNARKLRGIVEIDESLISHRAIYHQQHHIR